MKVKFHAVNLPLPVLVSSVVFVLNATVSDQGQSVELDLFVEI